MTESQSGSSRVPAKRHRIRWVVPIAALVLVIPLVPEALHVTLGANFHTVVERQLYRAAQPDGATLAGYIRDYGIRTVINLRGPNNEDEDWFKEEKQVVKDCGVKFVSVNMSASDKPMVPEMRRLIDTFDDCLRPILVHCNSGSDRSGFASACFLLMETKATLAEARAQLSLRYGHFAWGRAGCLGHILDQYQAWLDAEGRPHDGAAFRHWAREIYEKDDWPDGVDLTKQ